MLHLRQAEYLGTPWRNGGGETLQVAVSPQGASIDAFDWRISLSAVVSEGAFSAFPGVDRTLCLVTGARIDLAVDGELVRVDPSQPACRFRGEAQCFAQLPTGPIVDLNVMTRRSKFDHRVTAVRGGTTLGGGEGGAWFVAVEDSVVGAEYSPITLVAKDALHLDPAESVVLSAGHGWLIEVWPSP